MDENLTPCWPPVRKRARSPSSSARTSDEANPTTPIRSVNTHVRTVNSRSPLVDAINLTPRFRNGYEVKPQTPSYKPYALSSHGQKRQRAFDFLVEVPINHHPPLTPDEWSALATGAAIIPSDCHLRDFQIQCSNIVIGRSKDVCVIAPTGQGKSLLWVLPLLVQKSGVSLLITPYTSLGSEGQDRNCALGIRSVFINANQKDATTLADAARGHYRVVFACVEMMESPAMAKSLHAESFKAVLSTIYIDESHLVHESVSWRPAYSRLHLLRKLIGDHIPIIAISATLPTSYRDSLCIHAGMKNEYELINLGNFRPELSTVIINMCHDQSSFDDIAFLLPYGSCVPTILQTLVYCDDIVMYSPAHTHQDTALVDFRRGTTKFLLTTEKLGAGMNFAAVRRVVQYLVRCVTLVRWSQRHGRGARTAGITAIGYLLVEKTMQSDGEFSVNVPKTADPGLLDLIHTKECCDSVLDKWLESPPRSPSQSPRLCCSNCIPSLVPPHELQWIMETFNHNDQHERCGPLTRDEKKQVFDQLVEWRVGHLREHWREQWPSYGPQSFISDDDLSSLAKHSRSITTVEQLTAHLTSCIWMKSWLLFSMQ
ncbi:hypothetical protein P692DRAFT_20851337 [Suillus brevipes Sb2]|nr:hypothetical protein P692DRAFT_20851337 [Suillus brevipes Sb2]